MVARTGHLLSSLFINDVAAFTKEDKQLARPENFPRRRHINSSIKDKRRSLTVLPEVPRAIPGGPPSAYPLRRYCADPAQKVYTAATRFKRRERIEEQLPPAFPRKR